MNIPGSIRAVDSMSANPKGYAVTSTEGPSWDMEPGRPAVFKLLSAATGDKIAVFEEVVPPGQGTPLHIHRTSDEVIYVLSGEFTFRLGDDQKQLTAGAWVFIPLGSVHGWRNSGTEDGRVFFIFTPGLGAKAFEEMRLQEIPLPDIDPAIRDEIFVRNGYEFITWDW
jgi:quercetin dioxygenase-like cupin family protein